MIYTYVEDIYERDVGVFAGILIYKKNNSNLIKVKKLHKIYNVSLVTSPYCTFNNLFFWS